MNEWEKQRYKEWREFYTSKITEFMTTEELRAGVANLCNAGKTGSPELLLIHAMHQIEILEAKDKLKTKKTKASIKPGALVFQDFAVYVWPECANREPAFESTVFDVLSLPCGSFDLIAESFGAKNNYGNGPIRVDSEKDLIFYD